MRVKKKLMVSIAIVVVFASLPSAFGATLSPIPFDEITTTISINPGEFSFGHVDTDRGLFATIMVQNAGYSFIEGEAQLPIIRKMVEIPQDSNPELILDSVSWEYTSLNELHLPKRIVPAQFSVEKIPEAQDDFVLDPNYYSTNAFLPEQIIKIADKGEIRGRRFALVEISPVQYNPVRGLLKIMSSCEITLILSNSDITKTIKEINRYTTPSYEKLFEKTFANYGEYGNGRINLDPEGYLIIVYDSFYHEIQPLVTLKEALGYTVTVTKTSDIPGGATTATIKNYIQNAYDNWNIPPAYVLLVGDTPQIPTFTGSASSSEADIYYVTVDGSDYLPDIHIGRFPSSVESHIEAMVEKTVFYEQGNFPSNEWIKKGAFIASIDYGQIAEQTHNYVIDTYLVPIGYDCDKIYESTGGDTSDIRTALNEGRSLCVYSGHGSPSGWGCVPFYQSDVRSLTNNGLYPFVCSHACSTNTFDDTECFGETWLREENKGGLAFWGASASTYWDEDDILEKSMFQSWWDDDLGWIGGMTDMALFYLYQYYSGGGRTQYYFEAYNVQGDPSVQLWTDDPNYPPDPPSIPSGPSEGCEHQQLTFSTSTTDSEGEAIYYKFSWGDGTETNWLGPHPSGQSVEEKYSWHENGVYEIRAIAKDINHRQSVWSEPLIITIGANLPPEPPTISALPVGRTNKPYQITLTSTDPEGHDILYFVSWGDGTYDKWIGPFTSGESVIFEHIYTEPGTKAIVVKAQDMWGTKSQQCQINILIIKTIAVPSTSLLRLIKNT